MVYSSGAFHLAKMHHKSHSECTHKRLRIYWCLFYTYSCLTEFYIFILKTDSIIVDIAIRFSSARVLSKCGPSRETKSAKE